MNQHMIKPVLFVLTNHGQKGNTGQATGFYLAEATHPLAVLEAAGIPVEFASIKGTEPPVDGLNLEDAINARYWNDEGFREAIRYTKRVADLNPHAYSALFFVGGHGTMWDFPDNPEIQALIRGMYESGGIVSAVCHGPSALVNVKLSNGHYLVKDKRISAFTDDEERAVGLELVVPFLLASQLSARGAELQIAPNWTPNVVVDERLITGQNPQSATGVGEALRDAVLKQAV